PERLGRLAEAPRVETAFATFHLRIRPGHAAHPEGVGDRSRTKRAPRDRASTAAGPTRRRPRAAALRRRRPDETALSPRPAARAPGRRPQPFAHYVLLFPAFWRWRVTAASRPPRPKSSRRSNAPGCSAKRRAPALE